MKKFLIFGLIFSQIFIGCGEEKNNPPPKKIFDLSSAKDGTYTAESSRDEKLGKSVLTLTIKDKKIIDAQFTGYDLLGNEKNETYGEILGKDSADYKKAQVAANAIKNYPQQLIETQDLYKVDAISGASISYEQFRETAEKILVDAKK